MVGMLKDLAMRIARRMNSRMLLRRTAKPPLPSQRMQHQSYRHSRVQTPVELLPRQHPFWLLRPKAAISPPTVLVPVLA